MTRFTVASFAVFSFALMACGPLEIRISKKDGVRALNGSLVARIDAGSFACGDTITGTDDVQTYQVNTQRVTGGCEFTFGQKVDLFREGDYASIKELQAAVRYVNRVELEVQRLDFFDDHGARFDVETRVRDMALWVNGQQVLNIDQVRNLPRTVVLDGEALRVIKAAVKNRQHCSVSVAARVVVLDSSTPTGVRCEYESQPTYVLSSVEI